MPLLFIETHRDFGGATFYVGKGMSACVKKKIKANKAKYS